MGAGSQNPGEISGSDLETQHNQRAVMPTEKGVMRSESKWVKSSEEVAPVIY